MFFITRCIQINIMQFNAVAIAEVFRFDVKFTFHLRFTHNITFN